MSRVRDDGFCCWRHKASQHVANTSLYDTPGQNLDFVQPLSFRQNRYLAAASLHETEFKTSGARMRAGIRPGPVNCSGLIRKRAFTDPAITCMRVIYPSFSFVAVVREGVKPQSLSFLLNSMLFLSDWLFVRTLQATILTHLVSRRVFRFSFQTLQATIWRV